MNKLFLLAITALLVRGGEPDVKAVAEGARIAWDVPGLAIAVVRGDKTLYIAGHGLREVGKPSLEQRQYRRCRQHRLKR